MTKRERKYCDGKKWLKKRAMTWKVFRENNPLATISPSYPITLKDVDYNIVLVSNSSGYDVYIENNNP